MTQKLHTLMFMSKARWHCEGKHLTKHFYSLAKSNYVKKYVFHLCKQDGQLIEDANKILKEQHGFYSQLYTKDNTVQFQLNNKSKYMVRKEDHLLLTKEITKEEILEAIEHFPSNKCPSIDGLPVEFYQKFKHDILEQLVNMYQYAFENGELNITVQRGYLTLIPKGEKTP